VIESHKEGTPMEDLLVMRREEGRVAVLSLHRPGALNAWDRSMAAQLTSHLSRIDEEPSIKACILTGDGPKSFCAGAFLKGGAAHAPATMEELLRDARPRRAPGYIDQVLAFRKPLITAVNGYAIGAGLLLSLCSDIVIASSTAQFKMGQLPHGLMPTHAGVARLAQWVGRGRAMEITLSGRFVAADEAERIGLVSRVVPPEQLMSAALEVAEQIAALPELAVALTKESMLAAMEDGTLRAAATSDLYRFMGLTASTPAVPEADAQGASPDRSEAV
jgi:enoyl-CoA hydratase/carnithine racemase